MSRAPRTLTLWLVFAAPALAQPCLGLRTAGGVINVSTANSESRSQPAIAFSNPSAVFAIVWRENIAATGNDIYYRFVGGPGSPQDNPTAVITKPDSQSEPDVAWNSTDNQFLVIWESQESGQDCFGRTLTPAGALGASDFEILGGANEARVAYGSNGNRYFVTIRGGGCDGQRVNPNSTLQGAKLDISTAGSVAPNGDVTYDTINNRFFAIWRDQGAGAQNVQGRLVNTDGTFPAAQFTVMNVYPNNISVAFDPLAAQYLVVCDRLSADGLRAQFVSAAGAPVGGVITITDEAADDPDVAFHPAQNAFVVVAERGNDIVAYVVQANGTVAADKVVLNSASDGFEPAVAYNPARQECMAVWAEQSGSNNRIAARRLYFGGGANTCNPLCGFGLCGFGFFPLLPVTLAGLWLMKRGRRFARAARGATRR